LPKKKSNIKEDKDYLNRLNSKICVKLNMVFLINYELNKIRFIIIYNLL